MATDETPAQPTTHVHECACNRNWGGPCGQCVCEPDVRLGVGPAPDGNAGGADVEAIGRLTMQHNFVVDEALRLRAELAEAIRERDEALEKLSDRNAHIAVMGRKIRHVEDELDEARAKIAGGEWATRYYGDADQADRNVSWSTVDRPAYTHRRRVWIGPVEPADSDGTS